MVSLNHTTTIRNEVEEYIQREGLNFSQLGRLAGLNVGTVSSLLKGNRIMAVDQLDRMTAVLCMPKGHFYEQYIQECMVETVPNWRRIRPLLYRCAELDKLNDIRQIVELLMDNLTYSPLLFEVAEEFFKAGKHSASTILYESVAASERRQHSERLAFCQYRLFTLRLGDNQEHNLQAALQFEPYVDRLDEIDQLDALKDLANTYRSLRRWNKVYNVAIEMGRLSQIQLHLPQREVRNGQREGGHKRPSRPLFTYLALSNLFLANVSDEQGDYEKALQYINFYADLSWVKEEDEETQHWINLFKKWAQANTYVTKLLSGDESVLPDYIAYIRLEKEERLTGILNIIKAANQYAIDVDDILQHFEPEILSYVQQESVGVYTQQFISEQSAGYLYEAARYYLNKELYKKGFEYLIDSLEKYSIIKNEICILKCVRLFERFREHASYETQTLYRNLVKEEGE